MTVFARRTEEAAATAGNGISRHTVLGIGISAVSMDQAAEQVCAWARTRARATVAVAAVHSVVDAQDDPVVKAAMDGADLCVPDGVPLVWLLRRAGFSHVTRVFGPDLMLAVCARLAAEGARMFYYGGAEGVADDLARAMEGRFPGLRTAGAWTPPFRPLSAEEEEDVARRIEAAAPDVLWVGLGSPRQEAWMAAFRPRLSVPVMLGVGAAFDYNTGRTTRAPRWMQRCALEWVYRIIQEPRRLWRRYARNNPLFVWWLLRERLGRRRGG
jgi:N-acetylglucosaminyldiphosphoundecaprenol N-acetyl-beta-D-mannosaminyltransferase